MPSEAVVRPDITTGDPYAQEFRFLVNNTPIPGTTVVKAAVISCDRKKVYLPAVDCTYTAPVAPATVGTWRAFFSNTTNLLEKPSDLTSEIDAIARRNLDPATQYRYLFANVC